MNTPLEAVAAGDLVGLAATVSELSGAALEIRAHEDTHSILLPPGWKREDLTAQVAAQKARPVPVSTPPR